MAPTNERVNNRNDIPVDVALSILSKLPLKSLKRFCCVHKSWARLFEDSYFMSMFASSYYSCSNDMCLLLLQAEPHPWYNNCHCMVYLLSGERFENRVVKADWPPLFHPNYHITIGSAINGTLCVFDYRDQIALWNPFTGRFKAIPPSPTTQPPFMRGKLHGFGYDHVRDDYKLIQCVYLSGYLRQGYVEEIEATGVSLQNLPVWEIYSLRSNSWRILDLDKFVSMHHNRDGYVYTSGVCHWLSERETHLVSFNLSNEVFLTTPLPLDRTCNCQLVAFNGCVAMASYHQETTTFHISILGELGVRESWTKLFIVGPLPLFYRLIGFGKKGDIFFKNYDGEIARYDLSTQAIDKIEGINVQPWRFKTIYMEFRPSSVEEYMTN